MGRLYPTPSDEAADTWRDFARTGRAHAIGRAQWVAGPNPDDDILLFLPDAGDDEPSDEQIAEQDRLAGEAEPYTDDELRQMHGDEIFDPWDTEDGDGGRDEEFEAGDFLPASGDEPF